MSYITHATETRTSVDPWTGTEHTHKAITGWTCICGAKWRRAKRGDTTYTQAAWHLINKHGAPMAPSGDTARHEQWVIEVWDA